MRRYGYRRDFALGCVAGSACLGMLIPPSVLMIVWCVLTELSIGKVFLAGIIPGFLAAGGMIAYVVVAAILKPELVGGTPRISAAAAGADVASTPAAPPVVEEPIGAVLASTLLVVALILGTLGAIWLGVCTPTEGASVGAVGSLILAVIKGIKPREVWHVVLDVGRTCGPLLLLLFCAQLYSRVLSMSGFTETAKVFLLSTGAGPWGILIVMVAIWFVLGCLIDSISIILLTVPIFAPIATQLGFDPIAFAIMGILAIETGLLTPPFGILVFTVTAAVPSRLWHSHWRANRLTPSAWTAWPNLRPKRNRRNSPICSTPRPGRPPASPPRGARVRPLAAPPSRRARPARSPATPPSISRCWKGSSRCAAAPACISAAPTRRRCIICSPR